MKSKNSNRTKADMQLQNYEKKKMKKEKPVRKKMKSEAFLFPVPPLPVMSLKRAELMKRWGLGEE